MLEKVNITLKALSVFKNPTKYFSQEQIDEAIRLFYQSWTVPSDEFDQFPH